ncbi:7-carboxy-7-deazaguanine synthase [Magnetovibrio sp.]|uniref:7-carboxy-7-deazaguanine synthase n=1 Tax=Magnetovibrio sp. TaxID=2024836 RepID=UPI002F957DFB
MSYSVKEMFYSLQGEGGNTGRAAVFCRFAGCNLWSGREQDRAEAQCDFCDTDFVGVDGDGGAKFADADAVADAVEKFWPVPGMAGEGQRFVILTGGEPALQVDEALIDALRARRFEVAIETNGTLDLPQGLHWITVSPKGHGAFEALKVTEGDELKLVYPQNGIDPAIFTDLAFDHLYLQPKDDENHHQNTLMALDYCRRHPKWRLSLQTHKLLGIR